MQRKTPQQKKRLSLDRDRRNVYGENSKSSRKNIARNKRIRVRNERRVARAPIAGSVAELDDDAVFLAGVRAAKNRKRSWKKVPDETLGAVLNNKKKRVDGRFSRRRKRGI